MVTEKSPRTLYARIEVNENTTVLSAKYLQNAQTQPWLLKAKSPGLVRRLAVIPREKGELLSKAQMTELTFTCAYVTRNFSTHECEDACASQQVLGNMS